MSIDARVAAVRIESNGSGVLVLMDRPPRYHGDNPGIAGQETLRFVNAPPDVLHLRGRDIWGSNDRIMLGEVCIARRVGYTWIEFTAGRREWLGAVLQ